MIVSRHCLDDDRAECQSCNPQIKDKDQQWIDEEICEQTDTERVPIAFGVPQRE